MDNYSVLSLEGLSRLLDAGRSMLQTLLILLIQVKLPLQRVSP
jgi:hypothetical protein